MAAPEASAPHERGADSAVGKDLLTSAVASSNQATRLLSQRSLIEELDLP